MRNMTFTEIARREELRVTLNNLTLKIDLAGHRLATDEELRDLKAQKARVNEAFKKLNEDKDYGF